MSDEESIRNLIARYAECMDAGDFEGVGDLLAQCTLSSVSMGFERSGRNEIVDSYVSTVILHDDGTPRTKHVTTNIQIAVDEGGTVAASRSYFIVLQSLPGWEAIETICTGRYEDRFEKAGGAWRFARRHIIREFDGDLTHHLRQAGS